MISDMKKNIFILTAIIVAVTGCRNGKSDEPNQMEFPAGETTEEESAVPEKKNMIVPEGSTLETRFAAPEGYKRVEAEDGSLSKFLREYELKEDGASVLLYNGNKKEISLPMRRYSLCR